MSRKSINGRNSIFSSQLPQYLRGKLISAPNLNASSTVIVNNNNNFTATCGETVTANSAVGIKKSDGKIYNASNIVANDLYAVGIAVTSSIANSNIEVKYFGEHKTTSANFVSGSDIYLCNGSLNYSTNLPDMSSGLYYQKIGYAIDSENWIIDIEEAMAIQ